MSGLEKVSLPFKFDRSSILQFSSDKAELLRTHMWEREGINPDPHGVVIKVNERFPQLFEWLINGKEIIVRDTARSDEPDREAAAYCRGIGIRSFIMLPMIVGGDTMGAVVFSSIFSGTLFSDELVKQLRLVSTIFANAIARRRAD